jgi:hypothetical protein
MRLRHVLALVFLAIGCAPRIPYRYTPGVPALGARGTIELAPRATVGELYAAVRGALDGDCVLWFPAKASPGPGAGPLRLVVVSGELRLPAEGYCEARLVGRVGVIAYIVLSAWPTQEGLRWCEHGDVMSLTSRGTITSLQHLQRMQLEEHSFAWAAWSSDDAHQTLATIQRFQDAGVPLVLVDEGKADARSTNGLHGCEPRDDPPD